MIKLIGRFWIFLSGVNFGWAFDDLFYSDEVQPGLFVTHLAISIFTLVIAYLWTKPIKNVSKAIEDHLIQNHSL